MAGQSVHPRQHSFVRADRYHHAERNIDWSTVAGMSLCAALGAIMVVAITWPSNPSQQSLPPATGTIARIIQTEKQRASRNESQQISPQNGNAEEEGQDEQQPAGSNAFDFRDEVAAETARWEGKGGLSPFECERPLEIQNTIDELVFSRWSTLNIEPARLCSDATFLRRVYLDALGTLPTIEEVQQFVDDPTPKKRAECIEHVLERPEFADYFAMKWCDILRVKAEFPIKLWPNAAQAYHRWIRTSIADNMPYDVFARELLTASGSNFRTPQVNFYRAVQSKEAKGLAEVVALTFLCERADKWPAYRLEGMSEFFSQVGYKPTGEWKEEIVFFDPRKGSSASENESTFAVFPDGSAAQIPRGQDPRQVFADWLVDENNPWFARAVANRIWYWLLGRGIVHPIDDVRRGNPASNLDLLNHLAEELIAAKYDLRHLYREILNSHTYQLSCIARTDISRAAEEFAFYLVRRLDAEILIDAIGQLTGTIEPYSSIIPEPFTFLPDHQRAIALPDGSITSSFLEMFGRPPRDTGLEDERNNRFSAAQALHMLNSNHLRNKLKNGPKMKELIERALQSPDPAELLYMAILSRRPQSSEHEIVDGLCQSTRGAQDVVWALVNTDEFLFRH